MTTNQPNSSGFQWGGAQRSGTQNPASPWGAGGGFGQAQPMQSNVFGSSFQGSASGQTPQSGASQQNAPGSNPFSTFSGQQPHTTTQPLANFQQPSSFGQSNTDPGTSFGQARASTPSGGFGFMSNQGPAASNTSFQRIQPAQGAQNTGGGLAFGSMQSSTPVLQQTSFGQTAPTQAGTTFGSTNMVNQNARSGGFGLGQGNTALGFAGQSKPTFGFGGAPSGSTISNQFRSGTNRPSTGFGFGQTSQIGGAPSTGFSNSTNFGVNTTTVQPGGFGQPASSSQAFSFGGSAAAGGTTNPFGQQTQQPSGPVGNPFGAGGIAQTSQQTSFGAQPAGFNSQQTGLFGAAPQNTFGKPIGAQNTGGLSFGSSGTSTTNLFPQQTSTAFTGQTPASGQPFGGNTAFSAPTGQFGATTGRPSTGFAFGSGGATIQSAQPALTNATTTRPFSFGASLGVSGQQPTAQAQPFGGANASASGSLLGSSTATTIGGFGRPSTFTTTPSVAPTASSPFRSAPTQLGIGSSGLPGASPMFGTTAGVSTGQPDIKPTTPFSSNVGTTGPTQSVGTFFSAPSSTQPSSGNILGGLGMSTAQQTAPPLVGAGAQAAPGSGQFDLTKQAPSVTGAANLFALDKPADGIAQQASSVRSEYSFLRRDEFERLHPIMQKLLKIDSRSRVSHPEYRSRGFLIEPCDAEKSANTKEALKELNADVQDALLPDSIRLEWTACAKETVDMEENLCPVPCASAHVLGKRCLLQQEEMKKHHREFLAIFEKFDSASRGATLNQQWLDEYCTETRSQMHHEAFILQKHLLMLRYTDTVPTATENKMHTFVKGIQSILRGRPSTDVLAKYCCGPSFFELVCGKNPLPEVVATIAERIRQSDSGDGNHDSSFEKTDSQSTMEILDSLENVRVGTQTMLEILDADTKILENIEKSAKS